MPPLEPLDTNMVKRAKMILFQHSKRVGEREQTQSSAKLERASRTLPHLCITPSYLSVGPRRLEGIGVEEIKKTAKKYTRAKRELVSVLVHADGAYHTHCRAHYSNATLIDKRNGQKGMLGTRIIHVLCPW